MFGALVSAISVARPIVVAATPYVVNAAKVSAVVGAINFGTRLSLRGGANYLRRKANQEGVDKIKEEMRTNPEMSREDFHKYAAEMPGFRKMTLKETFAFLWDVTWTSGLTSISTFWATLTLPIYGTAWLLRYTGNIGFWIMLRFGRLFGMAPWTEKSYNDRFQDQSKKYYWAVRTPTMGVAEKMNTPMVMGMLYEIQRAFFPSVVPDFYTWYDTAREATKDEPTVTPTEPVTPTDKETVESEAVPVEETVQTFDSLEVLREKEMRRNAGLHVLYNALDSLQKTNLWSKTFVQEEPENAARSMRHYVHIHNRKRQEDAEKAVTSFIFFEHLDGFTGERFASEFLQQGIRVTTDTSSGGSHAV